MIMLLVSVFVVVVFCSDIFIIMFSKGKRLKQKQTIQHRHRFLLPAPTNVCVCVYVSVCQAKPKTANRTPRKYYSSDQWNGRLVSVKHTAKVSIIKHLFNVFSIVLHGRVCVYTYTYSNFNIIIIIIGVGCVPFLACRWWLCGGEVQQDYLVFTYIHWLFEIVCTDKKTARHLLIRFLVWLIVVNWNFVHVRALCSYVCKGVRNAFEILLMR